MSCVAHRDMHQRVARETWLSYLPHLAMRRDYKFVLGALPHGVRVDPRDDEIVVFGSDSYEGLWVKQRLAYRWAVEQGYQRAFVACIDTYIALNRLVDCGDDEYVGNKCEGALHAAGGPGYWLGARALRILAADDQVDRWVNYPAIRYPDELDGRDLAAAGIRVKDDKRHWCTNYDRNPFLDWDKNIISVHLSRGTGKYHPLWMYACHLRRVEFFNRANGFV